MGTESQVAADGAGSCGPPRRRHRRKESSMTNAGSRTATPYHSGRTRQRPACASNARTPTHPDSRAEMVIAASAGPSVAMLSSALVERDVAVTPLAAKTISPNTLQVSANAMTK